MRLKDMNPKTLKNLRHAARFLGKPPSLLLREGEVSHESPNVIVRFPIQPFGRLRLVVVATERLSIVRVDFVDRRNKKGSRILFERWSR